MTTHGQIPAERTISTWRLLLAWFLNLIAMLCPLAFFATCGWAWIHRDNAGVAGFFGPLIVFWLGFFVAGLCMVVSLVFAGPAHCKWALISICVFVFTFFVILVLGALQYAIGSQ